MKNRLRILQDRIIRLSSEARHAFATFTFHEKLIWSLSTLFAVLLGAVLLYRFNESSLVLIPAKGGTLTEGIVGTPRLINPLLASSDADKDLVSLIYSGLMRFTSDGELVPDLAESYTVNPQGTAYQFIIKPDAEFHNGTPVTADDVVFTIKKAQDPLVRGTRFASWQGVTVEKISAREVRFVLKEPYALFLENTTLGILSRELWKDADSEAYAWSPLNLRPVGSGPFYVAGVTEEGNTPTAMTLRSFSKSVNKESFLDTIEVRFFPSAKELVSAVARGDVESAGGVSPAQLHEIDLNRVTIETTELPMPRVFALFLNQNQNPVLAHRTIRQALSLSAPRAEIIDAIFSGYAMPIDGPLPGNYATATDRSGAPHAVAEAKLALEKDGWKLNADGIREKKTEVKNSAGKKEARTETLRLVITTSDAPELTQSADLLATAWKAIGADVSVRVYESGDLIQTIVRPRNYEALLFGTVLGKNPDPYEFWHSTQRNDPGQNVALYTNKNADEALEDARRAITKDDQDEALSRFEQEIRKDTPAIFLYSPQFIYLLPKTLNGVHLSQIAFPSDRFASIEEWYVETDHVWPWFADVPEEEIQPSMLPTASSTETNSQ